MEEDISLACQVVFLAATIAEYLLQVDSSL
jgi:hypothetical protein